MGCLPNGFGRGCRALEEKPLSSYLFGLEEYDEGLVEEKEEREGNGRSTVGHHSGAVRNQ